MNNKDLPRFAGRSPFTTQRVIGYFGCETVDELVKKIREDDIKIHSILYSRNVGAKWVAEFVKEYGLHEALAEFNKYSIPSKRIGIVKEPWSSYTI